MGLIEQTARRNTLPQINVEPVIDTKIVAGLTQIDTGLSPEAQAKFIPINNNARLAVSNAKIVNDASVDYNGIPRLLTVEEHYKIANEIPTDTVTLKLKISDTYAKPESWIPYAFVAILGFLLIANRS